MLFNYLKSKATADRLLTRFGEPAVLKRTTVTGSRYDPTVSAPTEYKVTVVPLDYTQWEMGGGRVQSRDKKVLLKAGAVEPLLSDTIFMDGAEYAIVGPDEGNGIKPLRFRGVTLLYEMQCRK